MKTLTLKLNTYAQNVNRNVNVVNNNNLQKRILNILLGSLGALALCYVIFLGSMVSNILERKNLESQARTLSNEVGDLEVQHLLASNKIDLTLAQSLGFKETTVKTFATRKTLGSLNTIKNEL